MAAGLLTADPDLQRLALAAGVDFLALVVDAGLLARAAKNFAAHFPRRDQSSFLVGH